MPYPNVAPFATWDGNSDFYTPRSDFRSLSTTLPETSQTSQTSTSSSCCRETASSICIFETPPPETNTKPPPAPRTLPANRSRSIDTRTPCFRAGGFHCYRNAWEARLMTCTYKKEFWGWNPEYIGLTFFFDIDRIKYLFSLSCGRLIWVLHCKILERKDLWVKYSGIRS